MNLTLGQALEQIGDADGACAAYGKVIERWGDAAPRSVTADKAKARVKALGCSARRAPQRPSITPISLTVGKADRRLISGNGPVA